MSIDRGDRGAGHGAQGVPSTGMARGSVRQQPQACPLPSRPSGPRPPGHPCESLQQPPAWQSAAGASGLIFQTSDLHGCMSTAHVDHRTGLACGLMYTIIWPALPVSAHLT